MKMGESLEDPVGLKKESGEWSAERLDQMMRMGQKGGQVWPRQEHEELKSEDLGWVKEEAWIEARFQRMLMWMEAKNPLCFETG